MLLTSSFELFLRPLLRSMKQAKNFYVIFANSIDNEIGSSGYHQFAGTAYSARMSYLRRLAKQICLPFDRGGKALSCHEIVMGYIFQLV